MEGEEGDLNLPVLPPSQPTPPHLCLCPTFSFSSAEVAGQCPLPSPDRGGSWSDNPEKILPHHLGHLIPLGVDFRGNLI